MATKEFNNKTLTAKSTMQIRLPTYVTIDFESLGLVGEGAAYSFAAEEGVYIDNTPGRIHYPSPAQQLFTIKRPTQGAATITAAYSASLVAPIRFREFNVLDTGVFTQVTNAGVIREIERTYDIESTITPIANFTWGLELTQTVESTITPIANFNWASLTASMPVVASVAAEVYRVEIIEADLFSESSYSADVNKTADINSNVVVEASADISATFTWTSLTAQLNSNATLTCVPTYIIDETILEYGLSNNTSLVIDISDIPVGSTIIVRRPVGVDSSNQIVYSEEVFTSNANININETLDTTSLHNAFIAPRVKIKGDFNTFHAAGDLDQVVYFGDHGITRLTFSDAWTLRSLGGMFPGCTGDINSKIISNITDMSDMFYYCTRFNGTEITQWDVSNVTNMDRMFRSANNFKPSPTLNNWDVSNVTSMKEMFRAAYKFNQPIDNWNTANVTDMGSMFMDAIAFNQDLSGWCVTLIPTEPTDFDTGATNWTLARPVWGTCPP